MRIWTYVRPFNYEGNQYEVKFSYSFTTCTSQLFCNGSLLDESTYQLSKGLKVIKHQLESQHKTIDVEVSVGYISWWSVGVEVREGNEIIYASHPGKDINFAEKKLEKLTSFEQSDEDKEQLQQQSKKWQKNKHSLIADIGLGIAFFVVAKVTGDLTTAALVGVALGLALVVIQRFVKVDLLGGFAVFGTIMLLISGLFSIIFQSEYIVQIKGSIMSVLSASVFFADGLFRNGRYFGPRFERYLNSPVEHQFFVLGLGGIALMMSALNYSIATYMTKDFWLTYTTFFDTPLYMIMFFILIWRAGKKHQQFIA